MAADKRENSVLFSLRELRQIEDDRVKQEEHTARARIEEVERQKRDAEQKVRDEADRKQRAIEDAERARADELAQRRRDEELKLEETERKHRVEHQARLEEERLRMEIEAKAKVHGSKRMKILVGSAVGMFVLVLCLGLVAYKTKKDSAEVERLTQIELAKRDKKITELLTEQENEKRDFTQKQSEMDGLLAQIRQTNDVKEQQRLQREYEARKAEQQAIIRRQDETAKRIYEEKTRAVSVKCKDPNDPLCGISR